MSTTLRTWFGLWLLALSAFAYGQGTADAPEFAEGFDNQCRRPGLTPSKEAVRNVHWFRCRNSDTVVVFVHGFNSNNQAAWLHEGGAYWPTLVTTDRAFDLASVVLLPFYSALTSGQYGLFEASRGLWDSLTTKDAEIGRAVLDHQQVLFVAHSTGGVLLRHALAEYQGEAILKGKRIGLLLVASPSEGSDILANVAPLVDGSIGISNKMLQQLRPGSEFLGELLIRFRDVVNKDGEQRGWTLVGRELAETQPVTCNALLYTWLTCRFLDLTVVSVKSATAHFGKPLPVPERDHISLAKPVDLRDRAHEVLRTFYSDHLAGRERFALVPIPYFYSVASIAAPLRSMAAAGDLQVDFTMAPKWRYTVVNDKCLSSEKGAAPQAECGKKLDLLPIKSAGYVAEKIVFCSVTEQNQAAVCSEAAPPSSVETAEFVDVSWKGGNHLVAAWDGASRSELTVGGPVSDSAPVYEVYVAAMRRPNRPTPTVPGSPRYHRHKEPTEWFTTARQAAPPTMRISLFPASFFDVAPGREDERVRSLLRIETDPQFPGKVRYLLR